MINTMLQVRPVPEYKKKRKSLKKKMRRLVKRVRKFATFKFILLLMFLLSENHLLLLKV